MAINSVSSTDPTATAAPAATAPGGAMGKDAFLKLLVAQISHQDPLQPMEGTEFVTQLSQFSMVEQSVAQSSKLDVLNTEVQGLGNNQATALVGKSVTIRGSGIAFDGVLATGSNVTLQGPSQKTTATITDANGKAVRTIDLGPRPGGALAVTWDGKDDNGQPVAAGKYSLAVSATAANGSAVSSSQDVTGIVTKVSFDKGYPEMTLNSGAVAPISDLVAVGVSTP